MVLWVYRGRYYTLTSSCKLIVIPVETFIEFVWMYKGYNTIIVWCIVYYNE